MRTSAYLYSDAVKLVNKFLKTEGAPEWCGERWIGDFRVVRGSADCDAFPCPMESWSGETSAIYVYDNEGEEVFAVAYWCEDLDNISALMECASYAIGNSKLGSVDVIILDSDAEAVLYGVKGAEFETACLQYRNDPRSVFVLDDWQGFYPETLDYLAEVEWIYCPHGADDIKECQRAIILNGKPRVL